MRKLYLIALCCLMFYAVFSVLKAIDDHRNEWNVFLEANNCVLLKTAPSLREAKCYICDDGITYCK